VLRQGVDLRGTIAGRIVGAVPALFLACVLPLRSLVVATCCCGRIGKKKLGAVDTHGSSIFPKGTLAPGDTACGRLPLILFVFLFLPSRDC
jgi:hypothetical protein